MPKRPTKRYKNEEDTSDIRGVWADYSNRLAIDVLLRKHGFKIYSRPKNRESIWTKGGVLFNKSEALKHISYAEIQDARIKEESYRKGYLGCV